MLRRVASARPLGALAPAAIRHLAGAAGRVVVPAKPEGSTSGDGAKKPRRRVRPAALVMTESAAERIADLLASRQGEDDDAIAEAWGSALSQFGLAFVCNPPVQGAARALERAARRLLGKLAPAQRERAARAAGTRHAVSADK